MSKDRRVNTREDTGGHGNADDMRIVAWGAFRDGKLVGYSLKEDEMRFEANGDWHGCEIKALYA